MAYKISKGLAYIITLYTITSLVINQDFKPVHCIDCRLILKVIIKIAEQHHESPNTSLKLCS